MKFQNIVRHGLIFAGLSAAIVLLPATVKAQEITNTEFADGPNVVAFTQPVAQEEVTVSFAIPANQVIPASTSIANSDELESVAVPAARPSAWVTFLLTFAVGLIALYTLVAADRASRNLRFYRSTRTA